MKRKTHEEYVEELKIKNPTVCVIGKYIDANTKIEHKCLTHDVCWMTTPSRALQGCGCEKCHAERIFKSKTRTHEEYVEQLKRVNPDIIPLESFKTVNDKILHYCKKHNVTWKSLPSNILNGHGCYKCGNEKITLKNTTSFEEYQKELQLNFPELECIGDYINHTTPVLHKCKTCGYEWSTQPIYILKGVGCKRCNKNLRRNTQEYIDDLYRVNPQIELVGEYINMTTPTPHRCRIHDFTWDVTPNSIISNGSGCPICANQRTGLALRKSPEEYEKELHAANPDIICIDKYVDSSTKIKVKCLKCGTIWDSLPFNLLQGHGCPRCNISHGEKEIQDWLINHNIDFIPQKRFKGCKDKKTLPFDFYLPSKNTIIEYDGEQHYHPKDWFGGEKGLEYIKKHDEIKTQYCKNNNIELLRITYKDNIQSKLNSFFI